MRGYLAARRSLAMIVGFVLVIGIVAPGVAGDRAMPPADKTTGQPVAVVAPAEGVDTAPAVTSGAAPRPRGVPLQPPVDGPHPAGPPAVEPATLPSEPPNIVVFYLDDVSPHDGRLWNDPERTPNIHEHFIAHGIQFDQAISETPLCCPARANFLTGIHTHGTGVVKNLATLFDPSMHVGKQLRNAGYASMWVGKYLNYNSKLNSAGWQAHQAGWTALDAIYGANGSYESYHVKAKEGKTWYPTTPSTQMVADRAVMRFRETPNDQPIFTVLSFYDLHGPNHPQPEFVGDPRCAGIPPWDTSAYNEADVSDKPAGIQALPLLPYPDGWPIRTYCEQMLGVDRSVGQVIDELEAQGRLDNTVLVFTADNGTAWGAHRLGQKKSWAYTTPIPLYIRWPAAHWGDTPTRNSEVVSNIDLAPTFCDLGGCALGPYSHAKPNADGVSLVPLLSGQVANLGRDAVLEELHGRPSNSWSGLRTSRAFDPDHRWHYVEYTNGFRELYDLTADPWELENRASDPALAGLVGTLHQRLTQLRQEGIANGLGSIRIVQDSRPNSAVDVRFSGDLGEFTLDDDSDGTHGNSASFSGLPSGLYTITRSHGQASLLAQITCNGVSQMDVPSELLTIFLRPGDDVVCTWIDGRIQPDASIALRADGPFRQNRLYQVTPTSEQTVRRFNVLPGNTYEYRLKAQNDGRAPDTLALLATPSGPGTVSVDYFVGEEDVTAEVETGSFEFDSVAPGATREMIIKVTIGQGTPTGSLFKIVLTVGSQSDPSFVDAVKLIASR